MIIVVIALFFLVFVQQLYIITERVYLFRNTVAAARARLDHHLMIKSVIHSSKAWLKNKTLESMQKNYSLQPFELLVGMGDQSCLSRFHTQDAQIQVSYKQLADKEYRPLCIFAYTQEGWRLAKMLI